MADTINSIKYLVILDFDGTIIPHNSFNLFIKYLYFRNIRPFSLCNLITGSLLRKLRLISSLEFKNKILKIIKGKASEELQKIFSEFADILMTEIRKDALRTIYSHNKNGATTIIISGAIRDYLEYLKTKLEIDAILATELKYKDGICQGTIDGYEVIGDEKVKILEAFLKNSNTKFERIYFYTDSYLDRPLLDMADVKILINKKEKTFADNNYSYERWS